MTLREALRIGAQELKKHDCPDVDPVREAEALLAFAAKVPRELFFADPDRTVSPAAGRRFRALIARRRRHEPLAYLLGSAWFMGIEFAVDPRVLIPRPATEHVAAAAIAAARRFHVTALVDVGTGSGCVAVAARLALPEGTAVYATDLSAEALAVARKNARRLGADVRFLRGDLLAPARARLARGRGRVIVVANLPYIPSGAMRSLAPELRREPRSALAGGRDGLAPSRRLLDQLASAAARADVFFEILPEQYGPLAEAVRRLFPAAAVAPIENHQKVVVGLRAALA